MTSTTGVPRDVFIVYTKGDPFESKLVEAIKEQLYDWGLTTWVYEDWDWEKEAEYQPAWRSSGGVAQLDPVRYASGHPKPFRNRRKGPEADREMLAWMFEHCGAIVLVKPRGGEASKGTWVELDVLSREPHPAIAAVSWGNENQRLLREIDPFFDYRMKSASPRDGDVSVAAESLARCAWLACMMARLFRCEAMGQDVFRQLARSDALLNRVALRALRPVNVPLEADPVRGAVLADDATAEKCEPVLSFWRAGPGFTADRLASGKPPQDIIMASKTMRGLLGHWCESALKRFPALATPSAKISMPLGAAMLRIGKLREAIEEFTRGLAAPDAKAWRVSMLFDRALAHAELGNVEEAITGYTAVLADETLLPETRPTVLYNRAIALNDVRRHGDAERDLDEILAGDSLSPHTEALALVSRALSKHRTNRPDQAMVDYDRIIELDKAPVEARLKALINRGALSSLLKRHAAAIRDFDAVLALREATPRESVLALFNRADSKAQSDDDAGAREDYEAALGLPEVDAQMRAHIAARLEALKRPA